MLVGLRFWPSLSVCACLHACMHARALKDSPKPCPYTDLILGGMEGGVFRGVDIEGCFGVVFGERVGVKV